MKASRWITGTLSFSLSLNVFAQTRPYQQQPAYNQDGYAQPQQTFYDDNGNPIGTAAIATTTTTTLPPKPISISIGAFDGWNPSNHNAATNMAYMVADQMQRITEREAQYHHITIDYVKVPVLYQGGAAAFIEHLKSRGSDPDFAIGIGETPSNKVKIETSADSLGNEGGSFGSNLMDQNGQFRKSNNFIGLEDQIGFNFPVADTYCGLKKEQRSRIEVSWVPGNYVCNDLAYYLAQYFRPRSEINARVSPFIGSWKAQFNSQLAPIQKAEDAELKTETDRVTPILESEKPAKAAWDASYREYQATLAQYNKSHPWNNNYGGSANYNYGGGGNSNYMGNSYSGSGYGSPNQGQNTEAPPVPPAPYVSAAKDQRASITAKYDALKAPIMAKLNAMNARAHELSPLLGHDSQTRFTFFHVPESSGKAYTPLYEIMDARLIQDWDTMPTDGAYKWYTDAQAVSMLNHSDVGDVADDAKDFLKRRAEAQCKAQDDARKAQEAARRLQPNNGYRDPSGLFDHDRTGYEPPQSGVSTIKKGPHWVLALRPYERKEAIAEDNAAESYARLILDMIMQTMERQRLAIPSNVPLPRLDNTTRMPVGYDNRSAAKTLLYNMSRGYKQKIQDTPAMPGAQPKYHEIPVAPTMGVQDADCYSEFLDRVTSNASYQRGSVPLKDN